MHRLQLFSWKGMFQHVRDHIAACPTCACRKTPVDHKTGVLQPWSGSCEEPNDTIHVDIVGPLSATPQGNRWVLTVIDRYSKYPAAFPLKSTTAEVVCKVLFDGWITLFGIPRRIVTDQGPQFTGALLRGLAQRLGVDHVTTSVYHPQANGVVERFTAR